MEKGRHSMANTRKTLIPRAAFLHAREWFVRRAAELDPERQADVLLSGGVDSTTVLFAMLESGRRPRCVTFHVEGIESEDLRAARAITHTFSLEHLVVPVPVDLDTLIRDVGIVIGLIDWSTTDKIRKTVVQCCHPFLYVYPKLAPLALCGLAADDFYLTNRSDAIAIHRDGETAASAWRRSRSPDPDAADFHIIDIGRRHYGKTVIDFYDWRWFAAWIQQFPISQTHHPRQKWASVGIFEDYWRRGNFYRENSPFQVNSGLRTAHDALLDSPANWVGAKQVLGIYRAMAERQGLLGRLGTNLPRRDSKDRLIDDLGRVYGAPTEEDVRNARHER